MSGIVKFIKLKNGESPSVEPGNLTPGFVNDEGQLLVTLGKDGAGGDASAENQQAQIALAESSDAHLEAIAEKGFTGEAVDPETYAPGYTEGAAVSKLPFDKDSGSLLVNQRLLTPADQVSVAASVLPTGAAVEAKQDIEIDELSALNAAIGVVTSGAVTNPTSAGNVVAVLKGILSKVLPNGSGNISVETDAAGTDFVVLPSQQTNQVTIFNDREDLTLLVQQDATGPAVPVLPMTSFTFFGITNTNQLGVKRKDESTEQISVVARWEG